MVRVDMQNGNNADCPPFPGIGCGKKIMVFRSMGVASSREGIGAGIICKGGGVDFLNFISPFPIRGNITNISRINKATYPF